MLVRENPYAETLISSIKVYNLDRGVTQTLIERGINADLIPAQPGQKPPELIAAIIQDHAHVLEGLFQFVRGERPLSKSYMNELHAALMKHQDTTAVRDHFGQIFESKLLKGKYKERPNNPQRADGTIYEFCPPEQVGPEMERLLAMHAEHEKHSLPVEVEAAWLQPSFHPDSPLPGWKWPGSTRSGQPCLHQGGLVSRGGHAR